MITEKDLQEAIAECQGQRNPNAATCIKLAAFLIIQRELYGEKEEKPKETPLRFPEYSFSSAPESIEKIGSYGDTEFLQAIDGKNAEDICIIMDELMEVLKAINPRLYNGVIRKIDT